MALIHSSSSAAGYVIPNLLHTLVEQFYSECEPQKLTTKDNLASMKSSKVACSPIQAKLPKVSGGLLGVDSKHKFDGPETKATPENDPTTCAEVETASPKACAEVFGYDKILTGLQKSSKDLLAKIKQEQPVSINLGEPCYKEMLKWYLKKKGTNDHVETLEEGVLELTLEKHLLLREIRQLRSENELLRSSGEEYKLGDKRPRL
jgi:hypothetical protein